VIVSIKRHYQADCLRTLADTDDNIIRLWKKNDGVGCYIWCILGMVSCKSSNAGSIMKKTSF
jgi:hypothetical protein